MCLSKYLATNHNIGSNIDIIVDIFYHPKLSPIVVITTYDTIAAMNLQLKSNADSVQSNLGYYQLGLLALKVSQAVCNTLRVIPFIPPVNTVTLSVIPAGTSADQTAEIICQFTHDFKVPKEYLTTNNELKQEITGTIRRSYPCILINFITSFSNITTRHLLNHLYTTYDRLTPYWISKQMKTKLKFHIIPTNPMKISSKTSKLE